MKKTLVTHIRPHLDDICAAWLYQKYVPLWRGAAIKFIPTNVCGAKAYGGKSVDSDPNIVHVGVCRGKYDEHKGNINDCATTLVFKDLKKRKLLAANKIDLTALRDLTDYVLDGDLGRRIIKPDAIFEIGTVVMAMPDSTLRTKTGFILLEALLDTLRDRVILNNDWKKKKVFNTPWGKAVGISTTVRPLSRTYQDGYVLVVQIDPKLNYRAIRAEAGSKVDLTEAYKKVKQLEPKAEWYFHHSKKMLICGSEVAPLSKLSKLTLEQLIDLVEVKAKVKR